MARLWGEGSARWLIIIAVFSVLTVSFWGQARAVRATDGVIELTARAALDYVAVTVTNRSAEPITVERCTFHTALTGGVREPMYEPCQPQAVQIAPGEAVTDRIPVVQWLWGQSAEAHVRYRAGGQPAMLSVPLRRTWLFWQPKA